MGIVPPRFNPGWEDPQSSCKFYLRPFSCYYQLTTTCTLSNVHMWKKRALLTKYLHFLIPGVLYLLLIFIKLIQLTCTCRYLKCWSQLLSGVEKNLPEQTCTGYAGDPQENQDLSVCRKKFSFTFLLRACYGRQVMVNTYTTFKGEVSETQVCCTKFSFCNLYQILQTPQQVCFAVHVISAGICAQPTRHPTATQTSRAHPLHATFAHSEKPGSTHTLLTTTAWCKEPYKTITCMS